MADKRKMKKGTYKNKSRRELTRTNQEGNVQEQMKKGTYKNK